VNEREEALLDALFEDTAGSRRAALDADERAELLQLEAVLAQARAEAREAPDWSPLREGALVGRVLAETTRADLSWRGDLRLVAGFIRERLAASPALKVVAASLLVHLIALPVVGWYVLREPENRATIYFGPPLQTEDSAFLEQTEESSALLPTSADRLAERIENSRRRARFVLAHASGPFFAAGDDAPLEIRLLSLRTQGDRTQGDRWQDWVDDEEGFEEADRLQRALWIDVLLDRNVRTGTRSPLLSTALNSLAAAVRSHPAPGADPLARLERLTLDRARSYGLWEAEAGFDPLAVPWPFAATWCDSLAAVLRSRGSVDHAVLTAIRSRCGP